MGFKMGLEVTGALLGATSADSMGCEDLTVGFMLGAAKAATGDAVGRIVDADTWELAVTGTLLDATVGRCITLGKTLGSSVGVAVGGNVGDDVGLVVGEAVGDAVSDAVSDDVGFVVDDFVGDKVGEADGASLGLSVG